MSIADQHAKEHILRLKRDASASAEADKQVRERKYVGLDYDPYDYDQSQYKGVRLEAYMKTRDLLEKKHARLETLSQGGR